MTETSTPRAARAIFDLTTVASQTPFKRDLRKELEREEAARAEKAAAFDREYEVVELGLREQDPLR